MAILNSNPPIPVVPITADLAEPMSFVPNQPALMLPVRLETRFTPLADGAFDLRVRIYPDKVHIDTHEPELTEQEEIWGKHFWEQTWRAADDEEARKTAWRQLVERFDANRAAWIARALKPLNPADRPAAPVANDKPLPKAIRFPEVATKADAWSRAPMTRVLPKRWHVFGYAGGALAVKATGKVIPDRLATGPDPSAPTDAGAPLPDGELPLDDGMKWMIDYAEAERVGMGIRLRIAKELAAGLDFLLVFGTRAVPGGPDETGLLVDLLDAHHYTDGLAFLLNGTPSNNTADAPSGFSSLDSGQEESYAAERATPAFQAGDGSNADVLSKALGVGEPNRATFATLPNATTKEQVDARHMNRALWPATWGYYLSQMLGLALRQETTLAPDDLSWARAHFVEHVRAFGPLPAVRVGRQPYGIVPVTSLDQWKPAAGQEAQFARDLALRDFLVKLREVWRKNLNDVPRVGRGENPDQDFADIFSMDGISSSYDIRHLFGRTYLEKLWAVIQTVDTRPWWEQQQAFTRGPLNALGLTWPKPRLADATYSGWRMTLKGPAVQEEVASETAPLDPNYIELLLNAADLDQIRSENFGGVKPKGLLYSVLRHAMLQEFWTAAVGFVFPDRQSKTHWLLRQEQEIIGPPILTGTTPITPPWELLSRPLAGPTTPTRASFLAAVRTLPDDPVMAERVRPLLEFRESLSHLKTLGAARLQRQFAGALDLCSHRLDAWITSFATKRLAEIREASPSGILIGGYGWVMNLRPSAASPLESPPPEEQAPIFQAVNNPGFTHTPSLAQAATVAVLRSGHLTHSGEASGDLLAIDLSSARVRLAEWLLDGVRQGQPLGALLGYRFERRLHDARLDEFIPYFRNLTPLVAGKLDEATLSTQPASVESIAANNVVDGLALKRAWEQTPDVVKLLGSLKKLPDMDRLQAAHAALEAELGLLDDAVDAVSDALVAESVHHAVQGNPLRTAATLDAVASGEAPPPELEVVRTPRTGIALTHRLVTLFAGEPSLPQGWEPPRVAARANAEPHLNAWAAELLGSPANVRCAIERLNVDTGIIVESREIRLSELGLAPLDLIYATQGSRDAQPAEIEQRLIYASRRKFETFAEPAALRINRGRGTGWSATDISYGEFSEMLRAVRDLFAGARGVDASELDTPERNRAAGIDMAELQGRADRVEQALGDLLKSLRAQLADPGAADLEALRDLILRAAHFGVAGAVPVSAVRESPSDRDALLLQASSITREVAARFDRLAELAASPVAATAPPDDLRRREVERLQAIFGAAFVVLPRFALEDAGELTSALAASEAIQEDDPSAVDAWFRRAARVRDGIARFDTAIGYAEALETGAQLNLSIAQLPFVENDRWIGLPLEPGRGLSASRFSLVVQAADGIDVGQPLAGLLIDEWVEVVPNATETTGLVFQYDRPDAAPPQCILLAVPPDPEQPWNAWSLQQVLLETLDLARLRAVDLDVLDEVGHYLPALYFAANEKGSDVAALDSTVATDFSKFK